MTAHATRPAPSRRTLLRAGGALGTVVLSAAAGALPAQAVGPRTRVYVLVVDGCRPDEVTPTLTPTLDALRRGGTWFPAARSLPVMETIPNHVMMMTGVRPDRSGVPANSVLDRGEGVVRDLDRPSDLRHPTLLERLAASGRTTGTVLSKRYLYGIFGTRATYRWEPEPLVPVTEHAPDAFTTDALVTMVDTVDPDLVFTNLGDVDRVGHGDLTGSTTLAAARTAALASTDARVGRFVTFLRESGRWESSVLVVLADHSMDWSVPTRVVSLAPVLGADPMLAGRVEVAQNGGADLLYWTGADRERAAAIARIRALAAAVPGVLETRLPAELRLGPEAGDVVAYCRAGWRFSDPQVVSNPIPGNHGHPASEPIPFLLAGGSPLVASGAVRSDPARTVDVAPTVGAVFGLPAPRGGYDGTSRL
ncbi:alkaline phosphatase family protein [Oryzobacter sp. R7]|uniref:alkaline phosphatase family protein n=1 Tax=Oryzobacter faecalis TaxID=3388656 RepID=UPI00398CD25D